MANISEISVPFRSNIPKVHTQSIVTNNQNRRIAKGTTAAIHALLAVSKMVNSPCAWLLVETSANSNRGKIRSSNIFITL